MIGNTVTYSSKQLLIIAPQICCTKSIGKFSKKVAHASFLQCSAYIVLGQDDCLRKINSKILWKYSVTRIRQCMVNMGVSCPTHFPLEVIIIRSYPWWQEDSSLTSWNLSTKFIYIVLLSCKGFFKTAKEGENYSNFTKVLFGLISPCATLPCLFQKRPSSFLQFGQVVNIWGHLFEKMFSDLF